MEEGKTEVEAPKRGKGQKVAQSCKAGSFLRAARLLLACALGVTALMAICALIISRVVPENLITLGIILILAWTSVTIITTFRKNERARTAAVFSLTSVVLIAVQVLIFTFGSSTAGFLRQIDTNAEMSAATTPVDEVLATPFVLYISGKDAGGALSDVNQLAIVNPKLHRILLINTPRDYYVNLAGKQGLPDKLTHAGTYGLDTSIETLEILYAVDINYYVQINFESLVRLVDALGGIEVDSAYAFDEFRVGVNHLDGNQALRFSRNRYAFEGGDRTRGENQQRVIAGIIRKLSNPSTAINYPSIIGAMEGSFMTNFGSENIVKFAKQQIRENPNWSVNSYAVDGISAMRKTYTYPNQFLYVMLPNQTTVDEAKRQIAGVIGN
ncbi:MAG: LCP family protein [Candidatus Nomurabacteria bacterium]|jgi:LCP family protein required for cell wall assembly|nr:LCP family protein [Candidatus Nomurabacteria bacterium]